MSGLISCNNKLAIALVYLARLLTDRPYISRSIITDEESNKKRKKKERKITHAGSKTRNPHDSETVVVDVDTNMCGVVWPLALLGSDRGSARRRGRPAWIVAAWG